MSKAIDLRSSRSLELARRLQETAASFARKEDKLVQELRARRQASGRKFRDAVEKMDSRLAAQVAEVETQAATAAERITSTHEARSARIQRTISTAVRTLPQRAREAKERWMGDLQMRHLRAERSRNADLEAADRSRAEVSARLGELETRMILLERRAGRALGGFPRFRRLLGRPSSSSYAPAEDAEQFTTLLEEVERLHESAAGQLTVFQSFLAPRIFSYLPLVILLPLLAAASLLVAFLLGFSSGALISAGIAMAAGATGILGLHAFAAAEAAPTATAVASALADLHAVLHTASASASTLYERDRAEVLALFTQTDAAIEEQWGRAGDIESEFEKAARQKLERQVPRISEMVDGWVGPRLSRIEAARTAHLEQLKGDAALRKQRVTETDRGDSTVLESDAQNRWNELLGDWQREMVPMYREVEELCRAANALAPAWNAELVEHWEPPSTFTPATRFAQLDFDLGQLPEGLPKDPRLALPGPANLSLPLALTFPDHGSLLFETSDSGSLAVVGTVGNIILRLLSATPAGKLSFTIIDPVGLGQNFAGLMHLSDYEESLINRRIWTQREQIEERLAELSEHIEKVIQMYLRNEYATITEYNAQAGSVAEKYQFLVVADFPVNFSEVAAKRLQSIAVSGPRCGIFTLIHWDQRQPLPDGFVPDELRKNSVCLSGQRGVFTLARKSLPEGAVLTFDPPPPPELAAGLVHKIGKSSIDSNRVEVPFVQIAPKPEEFWTTETTNELKIAIGRTGATKLQHLAIGKGTRQHALFAGKTGSGKSTLFHVIITNLALTCSPEQVEFYLIDFKKGVEFKCYATKRLPHARVVAIESDREFALSVLQRVDEELKRRGDLFRKLGVQDLAGYKKGGGLEPMPRSLLLIDEFQEFFVDDDTIAQTASLLFDRIVRQGRAFGIHVLLGSQSLGGAYSLARATIGQMVIRVALQCNEADAYLIMDDSNSAPRLLSRPGEGIYNDAGGALEGNSPFQVVWLPDDERDAWLDKVQAIATQRGGHIPGPIVFEGNAPADVRENDLLRRIVEERPTGMPTVARCWLGAPNSIKGPTEAAFQRQSGNHLLIVGQREEATLSMLGLSLVALAAQFPAGGARFLLLHGAAAGSPDAIFLDRIIEAIPLEVTQARGSDAGDQIGEVAAELKRRQTGEESSVLQPAIFVLIHGLAKFKKLRQEDDFSFSMSDDGGVPHPAGQFSELMSEGSSHGIHLIVTVDTYNNVNRFINRKALSEFEMRVVFQMSANDSASLVDSPLASGLGLHRALFYHEHQGSLETFRPYALPSEDWIAAIRERLRQAPATV